MFNFAKEVLNIALHETIIMESIYQIFFPSSEDIFSSPSEWIVVTFSVLITFLWSISSHHQGIPTKQMIIFMAIVLSMNLAIAVKYMMITIIGLNREINILVAIALWMIVSVFLIRLGLEKKFGEHIVQLMNNMNFRRFLWILIVLVFLALLHIMVVKSLKHWGH